MLLTALPSVGPNVSIPEFSEFVKTNLENGRVMNCWRQLIDECAHFYMSQYADTSNSNEYKYIGVKMHSKYPCIKHEGPHPWVCHIFNNTLILAHYEWYKCKLYHISICLCKK